MLTQTPYRRIPPRTPNDLHVYDLHLPLDRHARSALHIADVVREVAHVLDTGGMGAVLRGVDSEFPTGTCR